MYEYHYDAVAYCKTNTLEHESNDDSDAILHGYTLVTCMLQQQEVSF